MLKDFCTGNAGLLAILSICVCLCMCSCRSQKVVSQTKTFHDTVYVSRMSRDSIYVHDSTWVYNEVRNDTVRITKYVQKLMYRDRIKVDTLYKARVDSVQIVKQEKLSTGQRLKDAVVLALAIVVVCVGVYMGIKRL